MTVKLTLDRIQNAMFYYIEANVKSNVMFDLRLAY